MCASIHSIHTYKHTHTHTQTQTDTDRHTHTHTYIYIYIYTHTHTHTLSRQTCLVGRPTPFRPTAAAGARATCRDSPKRLDTGAQEGSRKLALFFGVPLLDIWGVEVCNLSMSTLPGFLGRFKSPEKSNLTFQCLGHSEVKPRAVFIALILVGRQLCRLIKRCRARIDWASSQDDSG